MQEDMRIIGDITLLIGIVALSSVAAFPVFAGTTVIENYVNVSANTGGNSANGGNGQDGEDGRDGADGEDGTDGKPGSVIEGKSSASASVKTVINGETVVDTTITKTDGAIATSSHIRHEGATVDTHISVSAEGGADEESEGTLSGSTTQSAQSPGVANQEAAASLGITGWARAITSAVSAFMYGIFNW